MINRGMKGVVIFAFLASFSAAKAEIPAAGCMDTTQDTTKVVKRLSIKKVGGSMMAIDTCNGKTAKEVTAIKEPTVKVQEGNGMTISKENTDMASTTASYPGGPKAMREYIRANTRYPAECMESRLTGKAIVVVTIGADGTLKSARIDKGTGNRYMDEEALRVVRSMPGWIPASDKKNSKELTTHISVTFRPGR